MRTQMLLYKVSLFYIGVIVDCTDLKRLFMETMSFIFDF